MEVWVPIIDGMNQQIDGAIAMFDPAMEDYEAQLAALNARKEQLNALSEQLPLFWQKKSGKVNASICVLDQQSEMLRQSEAQAESQFVRPGMQFLKRNRN